MTHAQEIAALRRSLAASQRRERELRDAWQRDERQWGAHVEGYTCRRAVEGAARKHGARLGVVFQSLLARRLRAVDTRDGVLDAATAWRLVETWSAEGVRRRVTT